jgi:hypothetical protein
MKTSTKNVLGLLILCVLAAPLLVSAQADPVMRVLQQFLTWATNIILVLVVICIVIGGFFFVTAGGDTNKVDTAKKFITFAVIGLIVVLSAEAIKSFFATWAS